MWPQRVWRPRDRAYSSSVLVTLTVELLIGIVGVIVATIATVLAWRPFRQAVRADQLERRRHDPIRIELSPQTRRRDAAFLTIANVGDVPLTLGWAAMRASDGTEPNLTHLTLQGIPVMPSTQSDGAVFLLERAAMPARGVRWVGITVFDMAGHQRYARVQRRVSRALESRAPMR